MLTAFLFQGLPQFLGKSTIDFAGKLHQSSVRSLEVNNSSNKTITYNVVLDAPKEFSLLSAAGEPEYKHSRSCSVTVVNENVLMARLAPKSTFQLPIHFTARFAHSSSGLLMLKSRTIALNNLSILLFEVQSKVEAPTAQKMFYLKSPIYAISPPSKLTIDVENPFDCAGNFVLKMKETMCLDADGGNMAVVIAGAASNVPDATIIAGSQRKPLLPSIPKVCVEV